MARARLATTAAEFIEQWKGRSLSERASAQPHFIALCRLLDVPAPTDNPADDESYRFDALTAQPGSRAYAEARSSQSRRATETVSTLWGEDEVAAVDATEEDQLFVRVISASEGGRGFADVWKRGHFCWEYKRPNRHADLAAALAQLKTYKDSLDNPPLLIVCDIDHFEIHTNFTSYPAEAIRFTIDDLNRSADDWHHPRFPGVTAFETLRRAFTQPDWFRPAKRLDQITEDLAADMGELAIAISDRKGNDPHDVAHFIMQIVFSLFANDIGLIPDNLVKKILRAEPSDPKRLVDQLRELFTKMAVGGYFGTDEIKHFNGGLFRNIDRQPFPKIIHQDIGPLRLAARHDWSAVEPSILGTLFERSLDPAKRSQIGAHYTSKEDILLIVEPVVMAPLRREWKAIKERIDGILRESHSPGSAGEGRGGGNSPGSGVPPEVRSLLAAFF